MQQKWTATKVQFRTLLQAAQGAGRASAGGCRRKHNGMLQAANGMPDLDCSSLPLLHSLCRVYALLEGDHERQQALLQSGNFLRVSSLRMASS